MFTSDQWKIPVSCRDCWSDIYFPTCRVRNLSTNPKYAGTYSIYHSKCHLAEVICEEGRRGGRMEEEDNRQRRVEKIIRWYGEKVAGSTSPLTKGKGEAREVIPRVKLQAVKQCFTVAVATEYGNVIFLTMHYHHVLTKWGRGPTTPRCYFKLYHVGPYYDYKPMESCVIIEAIQ